MSASAIAGSVYSRVKRGTAGSERWAIVLELMQIEQELIGQGVLPPRAAFIARAEIAARERRKAA